MTWARVPLCASAVAIVLGLAAGPAAAGGYVFPLGVPRDGTVPPGFRLDTREATRIAGRSVVVMRERARRPLRAVARPQPGVRWWQVSFLRADKEIVRVMVDDRSGRVTETWTGPQIAWRVARGTPSTFKSRLDTAMVALCILFVLPFIHPRRRLRMFHLDLVALASFEVSLLLLNRGKVDASVALQYPPLLYLLGRMLWLGLKTDRNEPPTGPRMVGERFLVFGLGTLVLLRATFAAVWGEVGDVGYAGLFGADSIRHGWELYVTHPVHLDTYGPVNYLLYLPFDFAFPLGPGWERTGLAGARAAAIAFDLLVILLVVAVGRRLRPGKDGLRLGLTLAYAWAACPPTLLPLAVGANDALVPLFVVGALLVAGSPLARGGLLGLGAAAKFVPFALVPLFAMVPERRVRAAVLCVSAAVAVFALAFFPHVVQSGLLKVYDSTLGFQLSRGSPFTAWGLHPSLEWLHTLARVLAVAVVAGTAFMPRAPGVARLAALSAAMILAAEMAGNYWAHTYVAWFAAPALIAIFSHGIEPEADEAPGSTIRSPVTSARWS
jgi:hypothetical protein